jgi:hypothetical protein
MEKRAREKKQRLPSPTLLTHRTALDVTDAAVDVCVCGWCFSHREMLLARLLLLSSPSPPSIWIS